MEVVQEMNRVDIYWPRAEIVNSDGSVEELKVEEGCMKLLYAIRKVRQWQETYGDKLSRVRIEVRGEKGRLKYPIQITN